MWSHYNIISPATQGEMPKNHESDTKKASILHRQTIVFYKNPSIKHYFTCSEKDHNFHNSIEKMLILHYIKTDSIRFMILSAMIYSFIH